MTPGETGREGKVEVHVLEGYVTVQHANVNQGTNSLLEVGLSCDNDGVSTSEHKIHRAIEFVRHHLGSCVGWRSRSSHGGHAIYFLPCSAECTKSYAAAQ